MKQLKKYLLTMVLFLLAGNGIPLYSITNNFQSEIHPKSGRHISNKAVSIKPPNRIMSSGCKTADELACFLNLNNPLADSAFSLLLAKTYVSESMIEGVNHDIAFCQMCLETGFLKADQTAAFLRNNFCGLGIITQGQEGNSFNTVQSGIRAHIQHLKAYACKSKLKLPIVDTRFQFVRRGIAPTIGNLSGKWAADRHYASKIRNLLQRLYQIKSRT
ncbi:MAG TPA: glucosaminidase domain-containing protein [Bacteroidales bacterium]|nr:glucosaminidase domain-containing protein [Bacteroidales bacterium]